MACSSMMIRVGPGQPLDYGLRRIVGLVRSTGVGGGGLHASGGEPIWLRVTRAVQVATAFWLVTREVDVQADGHGSGRAPAEESFA